jgi:hypothetical protein
MLVSWLQTLRSEGQVHIPGVLLVQRPGSPIAVTEAVTKPARRWWKYLLILIGALAAVALALTIYINTESFQALVRRRLVAEVERITGGRAEIGSFHTIPFRLQVEVRNITVHGREIRHRRPLGSRREHRRPLEDQLSSSFRARLS